MDFSKLNAEPDKITEATDIMITAQGLMEHLGYKMHGIDTRYWRRTCLGHFMYNPAFGIDTLSNGTLTFGEYSCDIYFVDGKPIDAHVYSKDMKSISQIEKDWIACIDIAQQRINIKEKHNDY